MKKLAIAAAAFVCATTTASAVAWKNLSDTAHCAGPKITEADLRGKVVLVDCWGINCPPCRALLPRMEQVWKSFKHKPFVLVGSHCQKRNDDRINQLVKANKLTYPIYQGFGVAHGEPSFSGIPFLYVVNHRGKIVYAGHGEREATEAVVNAIGEIGAPQSLFGDTQMTLHKGLEKQLVLGKPVKTIVKKLESEARRGQSKFAKPAEKDLGREADAILCAVAAAKEDAKKDIEEMKESDPAGAVKLIKDFCISFPDDAAPYKAMVPELTKKAREQAAAAKRK